jgi:hypothetical protein
LDDNNCTLSCFCLPGFYFEGQAGMAGQQGRGGQFFGGAALASVVLDAGQQRP